MADVVLEYGNKYSKREGKIISICILNNGGISHFTQRKSVSKWFWNHAFENSLVVIALRVIKLKNW
jgi:hypothetical protein